MLDTQLDRITRKSAGATIGAPEMDWSMDDGSCEICPQTQWMLAVRDRRDKAAFAKLYDHFSPKLLGFVMRAGASRAQGEEIVQEVMLTLWRKAEQFDPHRATVSAWIYQITRNRHIDIHRKESRPVPEMLQADHETDEDSAQIFGLEQEAALLHAALARLAPQQREMVQKAYLGELSHREIKEETGLPLGTIKSRIRLGLQRLKHELKGLER